MPEYQTHDGVISLRIPLSEQDTLVLSATGTRKERTGVHSSVYARSACKDGKEVLLAWNTFNVGREQERKSLALAVHHHLPDKYDNAQIKHYLDEFCAGLWQESLKQYSPEELHGADKIQPPTFLLYPYIVYGGGTILFGPPGRGKSQSLLLMAQSIHKNVSKLWNVSFANNILFINLERSRFSIAQRLARVNTFLGLPQNDTMWTINARGRSLAEIEQAARKFIKEHDVDLVVVDSLSRTGFGSMKDDEDVNAAMDCLNSLCSTWLAAGHSPRGDDDHVFGSQMFDAAADVVVKLASQVGDDKTTLGIKLKVTKCNDGGKLGYSESLAYEFDDMGFTKARTARDYEFPSLIGAGKGDVMDNIKALLDEKGIMSATAIGHALHVDISNVSRMLKNNPDFTVAKVGKNNEKFYSLN